MAKAREFKNESAFTAWFCGELSRVGCVVWALVGGARQRPGLPDRLIHMPPPHPTIGAEFKRKRGRLRADQRKVLDELRATSTIPIVIRDAHPLVTIEKADGTVLSTITSAELQQMKPRAMLDWLLRAVGQTP